MRQLAEKTGVSVREYVKNGSDPSSVQVLMEDSSSVCGTLIAASCFTASWYFENPVLDAMGSVMIGGLLSSVAVFLIRRNMKMVVENSMPAHRVRLLEQVVASDPLIQSVQDVKTISMGPEHARFKAEVYINAIIT